MKKTVKDAYSEILRLRNEFYQKWQETSQYDDNRGAYKAKYEAFDKALELLTPSIVDSQPGKLFLPFGYQKQHQGHYEFAHILLQLSPYPRLQSLLCHVLDTSWTLSNHAILKSQAPLARSRYVAE